MPTNELDRFRKVWDMEAQLTTKLLEALPTTQYDFRPDPGYRSLGEMAWHLAEIEGYTSYGVSKGAVTFQEAPPNIKRPREVELLAPGYRQVHEEAVARLAAMTQGRSSTGRCRSPTGGCRRPRHPVGRDPDAPDPSSRAALADVPAGGRHAAGIYGPNREEMAAMRERMAAKV